MKGYTGYGNFLQGKVLNSSLISWAGLQNLPWQEMQNIFESPEADKETFIEFENYQGLSHHYSINLQNLIMKLIYIT